MGKKKLISIVLTVLIVFSMSAVSFAQGAGAIETVGGGEQALVSVSPASTGSPSAEQKESPVQTSEDGTSASEPVGTPSQTAPAQTQMPAESEQTPAPIESLPTPSPTESIISGIDAIDRKLDVLEESKDTESTDSLATQEPDYLGTEGEDYVPGQVLVVFSPEATDQQETAAVFGARALSAI